MRLFKVLLILFFFFGPAHAQDLLTSEIPAQLLFKENTQYGFSISPDGKYFAQIIKNNIETDIIIVDIDEYVLYQKIPVGNQKVQAVHWLTSNRILYESQGAIYAIDIDGTNQKMIVDRHAEQKINNWRDLYRSIRINNLISTLPGVDHQILIETYNSDFYASVKEVNIYTGKSYTLINGDKHKVNEWILDPTATPRLAVRYEEDGFRYFEYDAEKEALSPFMISLNGTSFPLVVEANSFINQNLTFEGFSPDPDIIYLTTNIDSDRRKLVSYSISQEKIMEVLVEDVLCDVKEPHGDDVNLIFDYIKGELAGVSYWGVIPQYKWYSPLFSEIHQKLNTSYPGYMHDFIDADEKQERFVMHQWSDVNAGNIGIYDATDGSYAVMFHFNNELNKYKLSKTKVISAESRDGKKLLCYLNLPTDYKEKGAVPLVVIPHGGPWVRDYWRLDEFCQYFTSRGYATLRVNFRGSTGFGKEHVLSGVSSIDDVMINDIADATKFVISEYEINADQAFIYGHSYGGYATYMSLVKYPEIFKAGVAVSAPTDIKEWLKTHKKGQNKFSYEFWNTVLGSNKTKYLDKISPINYAKSIDRPVLIFHGEFDKIIPVAQSYEMEKELKKYKKQVTLEVMQQEGHSISDANTMAYLLNRSHSFFQKKMDNE